MEYNIKIDLSDVLGLDSEILDYDNEEIMHYLEEEKQHLSYGSYQ